MNGPNDPPPFNSAPPYELHACQGLNACAQQGRNQTGTMPGDGDCATSNDHSCTGGNDCRGQGGCGYTTDDPNENACRGTGGCGTPIPARQIFHSGSGGMGLVWDAARQMFEARMRSTGNTPIATAPESNERRRRLRPT